MQTTTIHHIDGYSKAKTAKAILVSAHGKDAWIPMSYATVRFTGPNYKVRVTVPGWLFRKISWKDPVSYTKNTDTPKNPANPYIGTDYGNMMEEQMVLNEMLIHKEFQYDMYHEPADESTLKEMADEINGIKARLKMIDEAAKAALS